MIAGKNAQALEPVRRPLVRTRLCVACVAAGLAALSGCDPASNRTVLRQDAVGGETWSILCLRSSAPDHVRITEELADGLRKTGGIDARAVRVQHDSGSSAIYYGTYRKQYDPRTGVSRFPPELTRDISLIRSLSVGNQCPFLLAQTELVGGVKSVGPPEWDLRRAPGDLSLQIAVFYNEGEFQERETAAVQYVQALRAEGIEAWYLHGPEGRSIVTVGHFPFTAMTLRIDGSQEVRPEVQELQNSREEFKYNLVNGRIMRIRAPNGEFRPMPSFLVPIPRPGTPGAPEGLP